MPLTQFSPNAKNTGAALFISFNSKDGCVFIRAKKQTSWSAETKKGGFKDGVECYVKLSEDEVGDIIHAIRTKEEAKFYHSFDSAVTTGGLKYYEVDGEKGKKRGFGYSIKKGNDEFKVGFSLGAAEKLMEFLRFALDHINSSTYALDKKQSEEYAKNKAEKAKGSPKEESAPKAERVEPETDSESDWP